MLWILLDHGTWDVAGTVLGEAAWHGYLDMVKLLWDSGASVGTAVGGSSVLAAVAGGGYQDMAKELLDRGADVNAEPTEGFGIVSRTALRAAAGGGYIDVVKELLDHGAGVNAEARGGVSYPVVLGDLSVRGLRKGMISVDLGPVIGRRSRQRPDEVAKLLLDCGVDVNGAPARMDGRTALGAAAEGGYRDVVKLLLDRGVDVNAVVIDDGPRTMQVAAAYGHEDVVELGGADTDGGQPTRRQLCEIGKLAINWRNPSIGIMTSRLNSNLLHVSKAELVC